MYLLHSRYYDPVTGRFLNVDGSIGANEDMLAYNLFAYCSNDPVNFSDPSGQYKVLSANRVQVERGDTLWGIAKALTGNGANWKYFGYNDDPSKLQVGHILNASRLPKTGKPNSKDTLHNPDGTPKQERSYGPNGEPVRDRDYNHGGHHEFPHDHVWDNGVRGPAIPVPKSGLSSSDIRTGIGIGLGTVGAGYLIYRGIRMIPSLFPALWWTIPANVAVP